MHGQCTHLYSELTRCTLDIQNNPFSLVVFTIQSQKTTPQNQLKQIAKYIFLLTKRAT